MSLNRRVLLAASASSLVALTTLAASTNAQDKVWRSTAEDVKAANRVELIGAAEEAFKAKNGIYAKTLALLHEHKLLASDVASGVLQGFKFEVTSDEKTFSVMARPANQQQGFRTYLLRGGKKIRSAEGRDATAKDQKVTVWNGAVKADSQVGMETWAKTTLSANEKQEVHVAAEGEWKVGPTWKACGAGGSTETSGWGDYRLVKGDSDSAKVGCLLAQIEGKDIHFFATKDDYMSFIAPAAGLVQFRMNVSGARTQSGELHVWAMVIDPIQKDDD